MRPRDLLRQGLAGARQGLAVQQTGVEQFLDDDLDAAFRVDIDHRIAPERPRIDEHRDDMLRQVIEFFRRHDVSGKVTESGGSRDLRAVQQNIGRAADGHRDRDSGRYAAPAPGRA